MGLAHACCNELRSLTLLDMGLAARPLEEHGRGYFVREMKPCSIVEHQVTNLGDGLHPDLTTDTIGVPSVAGSEIT